MAVSERAPPPSPTHRQRRQLLPHDGELLSRCSECYWSQADSPRARCLALAGREVLHVEVHRWGHGARHNCNSPMARGEPLQGGCTSVQSEEPGGGMCDNNEINA